MPSPFPGMNPYLEQEDTWHDFHERFVPHAADVIRAQIVPRYIAKIDEHVYIHELTADERLLVGRADIAVVQTVPATAAQSAGASSPPAPAYAQLPPAVDVERSSFIEIRDRQSRELITVIELLSPSNKRSGPDREQYISKRRQLLASSVHLVEIDLLRGGPRMPMEDLPDCDYCAIVSRAQDRPRVSVWPILLREALPKIPIPLREPDPAAKLDLQQALHHLYDAAGYQYYIYSGRPQPPLRPDDAAWAGQFVPAAT
jgi:hypothetical protein